MTDEKTEDTAAAEMTDEAIADGLGSPAQTSSPTTVGDLDDVTVTVSPGAPPPSRAVVDPSILGADDLVPASLGVAKPDDGLVRTSSATKPIADSLATGAGAHHPPPDNVGADGREDFGPDGPTTARVDYTGPGAPPSQTAAAERSDDEPKKPAAKKATAAK